MAYDHTNSGALFRNYRKEEGSKQPDYTGKLNVNGVDMDLAAWVRTSKAGKPYLSVKIQDAWKPVQADDRSETPAPAAATKMEAAHDGGHSTEDDLPF